ncbi:MAG: MarR family transcriptional regulator [Clostridium sp.]|nr:MarR family transcriptional regulator [Clostridium sp.]
MDLVNYKELIFNKGTEITSAIHKKVYDKLRVHGIYPGQPELLLLIHYNEGIIQKELSSMNSTNESTIAIMLKKMEQGGYIERRVNAKDKRALEVHLTEKGRDLVDICEKCLCEIRDEIFQNFTDEDYNEILRFLNKLQENVKN